MKTYRTVLVGTGGIADAHVAAVATLPGRLQLVAACDIDAGRARAFCDRHKIPAAHTDFAAMLKAERPDLVLIAAPPALHADMSIAAMEAPPAMVLGMGGTLPAWGAPRNTPANRASAVVEVGWTYSGV